MLIAPGEIEQLDPPAPPADTGPNIGRATLRLMGLESALNQPLEENDSDHEQHLRRLHHPRPDQAKMMARRHRSCRCAHTLSKAVPGMAAYVLRAIDATEARNLAEGGRPRAGGDPASRQTLHATTATRKT